MPSAHYVEALRDNFLQERKLVSGPHTLAEAIEKSRDPDLVAMYPKCRLSPKQVTRKILPMVEPKPRLRRGAVLAFDDKCRLVLERDAIDTRIDPAYHRTAAWLMCNPSDADAERDDQTAGRVVHHSLRNLCARALVGNVWGWRTPQPSELWMALDDDLYTPEMHAANLDALAMIGAQADLLVVAFGVAPGRMYPELVDGALAAFTSGNNAPLHCLGTSDDGWPLHPLARGKLAISNDTDLQPWERPA